LESLHDTEGHWRKWQRWFIGFNWKALLFWTDFHYSHIFI
jgi:hypothetical protein